MEYESEVKQLLPLPPATLHMLLALADEDRLGYAINREPASSLGIALESGKTLSLSNTRI